MKEMRCDDCGSKMDPCPAKLRADGEQTYVGFYACTCEEARLDDAEWEEWNRPLSDWELRLK